MSSVRSVCGLSCVLVFSSAVLDPALAQMKSYTDATNVHFGADAALAEVVGGCAKDNHLFLDQHPMFEHKRQICRRSIRDALNYAMRRFEFHFGQGSSANPEQYSVGVVSAPQVTIGEGTPEPSAYSDTPSECMVGGDDLMAKYKAEAEGTNWVSPENSEACLSAKAALVSGASKEKPPVSVGLETFLADVKHDVRGGIKVGFRTMRADNACRRLVDKSFAPHVETQEQSLSPLSEFVGEAIGCARAIEREASHFNANDAVTMAENISFVLGAIANPQRAELKPGP